MKTVEHDRQPFLVNLGPPLIILYRPVNGWGCSPPRRTLPTANPDSSSSAALATLASASLARCQPCLVPTPFLEYDLTLPTWSFKTGVLLRDNRKTRPSMDMKFNAFAVYCIPSGQSSRPFHSDVFKNATTLALSPWPSQLGQAFRVSPRPALGLAAPTMTRRRAGRHARYLQTSGSPEPRSGAVCLSNTSLFGVHRAWVHHVLALVLDSLLCSNEVQTKYHS